MMNKTHKLIYLALAGIFILVLFLCAIMVHYGLKDNIALAEVAVVLGNKIEKDGHPSVRLKARLDKTLELYQRKLFSNIIVSGGTGSEGFAEAEVMKSYLTKNGVPAENIVVDNNGVDTYHTARFVAQYVQIHKLKTVLVVSQYYHVPRVIYSLKRLGIVNIYSAHAEFFEIRDLYSIPREVIACGKYYFRKY